MSNADLDEKFMNSNIVSGLAFLLRDKLPIKDYCILGEVGAETGLNSTRMFVDYLAYHKGCFVCIEWFRGSETTVIYDQYEKNKAVFEENTKDVRDKFILMPVSSEQAAKCIDDNTFDLFFIDADHRYEGVSKDIELWYPKVKEGGILCGHDYDKTTYDEAYIHQDWHDGCHHGVTKAVNERFHMKHNRLDLCWWVRKESEEKRNNTPTECYGVRV